MEKRIVSLAGGGMLLLLFALLVFGVQRVSFTADEPAHIAGGYALLARGREAFSMLPQRGYPPLLCGLEAFLVYVASPDIPLERLAGWPADYDSFAQAFEPYMLPLKRTKMVARMPIIFLTTILGAVVFRWGKELWDSQAGLLALLALVFDPTLLAHGRLATTDVGMVTLGTVALYAAWRWGKKPSWRWTLGTGILLGLAMLAKVSGILWIAAAGLMMLETAVRRRQEGRSAQLLIQGIVVGGLSLLVLWAGYGFAWGSVHVFPFSVPAPARWKSFGYISQYTSEVFALGLRKYGRWWWYFPLAFAIKNPLPLLIGWSIGLVTLLRRPGYKTYLVLGVFPLLYAGTAILTGMNIGYRHMLPVHPFLYLTIGGGLGLWGWGQQGRSWRRWFLGILGVWYAATTASVFPYEIAYFNELVGGAEGGYRYLADSNVAWGQSTEARDAYLQVHPDVRADPPDYKFQPSPGRYIVNASYLQGVGISDPYAYEWFRHWEPQEILNYSLLVYDVPAFETGWIAQCEIPEAPLDDLSVARGTGRDDLRSVRFDCTHAWVYPSGGTEPGIYVLHSDLIEEPRLCLPSLLPCPAAPDDPFTARHLAQARLSFEQTRSSQVSAFVLYEMSVSAVKRPSWPSVYASHDGVSPAVAQASEPLGSHALDGPLAFLGATAYREQGGLDVETWWRVTDGPVPRPFSIMAHLVSPDGQTLGMADGLGISPLAIAPGDVVVQRHRFSIPPKGTVVWLRTGAYWLDTMERWAIAGAPGTDALVVRLEVSR